MCPYVTVTDGCHEIVLNRLVFLRLSLFGNIRIRLAFSEVFDQKKSAEDFCFELTHICDEVLFCCLGHHRGYILLIKKQKHCVLGPLFLYVEAGCMLHLRSIKLCLSA